jgi:hypothetical protein
MGEGGMADIFWNAYGLFKYRRLRKRGLLYRVRNWWVNRFSKNRAYTRYLKWDR